MNRASVARRYAPLAAIAALQLLIIAVVPSKSADQVTASSGAPGAYAAGDTGAAAGGATGSTDTVAGGGGGTDGTGAAAGGGGTDGGAAAAGGAGGAGGAAGAGGAVTAKGDTSHCVGGRQFDAKIYPWAPPCAPKFAGDNGGANGQRGVTKDSIKVVVLRGNYGALVNKVLEEQGSFPSAAQFDAYLGAATKFINEHYELYGRKIVFKQWQLQCTTGGQDVPDDNCLRNEMRKIAAQESPFAVIWNNAVSSATYDELSQLKILNIGGYGFTDNFNRQHRPYHYDVQMGGNQLASTVAEWWCKRMYGNGQAKAQYAGKNQADDMSKRVRRIGVISTNDPENRAIYQLLQGELKAKCGTSVGSGNVYFYDQNIQTLQQQRTAAVAKMRGSTPDQAATSVMCFCDQVAPTFLYKTQSDQSYFPENIIVATGSNDLDMVAQSMDHGAEQPNQAADHYPQYENAFGLAQLPKQEPRATSRGARVWKTGGGSGLPPYESVDEDMDYYAMLGTLIQAAGPQLNAQNAEAGAFRLGAISPSGNASEFSGARSTSNGDYTWDDVMREVYWSPTRKSAFNGKPGTFVSLNNGRWFDTGQFPSGLLPLPPKPRG